MKKNRQITYRCYCDGSTKSPNTIVGNSLFDLVGRLEPDLTKSLGYVLSRSDAAMQSFLNKIFGIKHAKELMAYDCVVDCELMLEKERADIVISFLEPKELIIVEAKSPNVEVRVNKVVEQAKNYAAKMRYEKCSIVTLTNSHEYGRMVDNDSTNIVNLTWSDIVEMFDDIIHDKATDNLALEKDFLKYLLKNKSIMNYYDIEVLSIPAGKTIKGVEEVGIYECLSEVAPYKSRGEHKPLYIAFRGNGGSVKKLYKLKELISTPIEGPKYEKVKEDFGSELVERIEKYKQLTNFEDRHDPEDPRWVFILDVEHSINLPYEIRYERNNAYVETKRPLCDYFAAPNEDGVVVFGKKDIADSTDDVDVEEAKSTRPVKVTLGGRGFKRIQLLPLDDEGMEIIEENNMDAEEAFSGVYNELWRDDAEQLMEFMFADSCSEVSICVTDEESEEEIYSDDITTDPSYGIMSMKSAIENYEDDKEGLANYTNYLNAKMGDDYGLYISKGIKKAWNGLKDSSVSASSFVPTAMKSATEEAGAKKALLMGLEESETVEISFHVNLPEGEEFDYHKLEYVNFDEDYDDYSEVIQNTITGDMISLNAIIYDGKMYFAGHDDIDIFDDSDEEPSYDYVNADMTQA